MISEILTCIGISVLYVLFIACITLIPILLYYNKKKTINNKN